MVAYPVRAAHLESMTAIHRIRFAVTDPPPGTVVNTGANPEHHGRVLALRFSNAAVPHRNRYRDRARGLTKGGRAGAKLAARREADAQ